MSHARKFLFAWRWAISSECGPKLATDRHVALTLSLHMSSEGLGAWPSQSKLAVETGLTARTVREALKRLLADRWLTRVTRKPPRGRGTEGMGFQYSARLALKLANLYANGEAASLFKGKGQAGARARGNGEAGTPEMGKEVPTNATGERYKGSAFKEGFIEKKDEVEEMERAFREIP